MAEGERLTRIEYGVESVELKGQPASGDLHIVKEIPSGTLFGVIDGLGHGVEAADAAQRAVETIEAHSGETIINIAKACHERLRRTRGAVMALAFLNYSDETVTWLSIGNVEGILIRVDSRASPGYENIFMRPGVVGYRLPPLFASVFSISKNDLLIFSTDGIRNDYSQRIATDVRYAEDLRARRRQSRPEQSAEEGAHQLPSSGVYEFSFKGNIDLDLLSGDKESMSPKNLANFISKTCAKGNDDALVLVARYEGK